MALYHTWGKNGQQLWLDAGRKLGRLDRSAGIVKQVTEYSSSRSEVPAAVAAGAIARARNKNRAEVGKKKNIAEKQNKIKPKESTTR